MFHIGQEVECVDVSLPHNGLVVQCHHTGLLMTVRGGLNGLKEGATYTIRGFGTSWITGEPAVYLNEIIRPIAHDGTEITFNAKRFRAVLKKKLTTETGMAILRKIAADVSKKKEIVQ